MTKVFYDHCGEEVTAVAYCIHVKGVERIELTDVISIVQLHWDCIRPWRDRET